MSIRSLLRGLIPKWLWDRLRRCRDVLRSGISGVPAAPLDTDLVGYEKLIRFIASRNVLQVAGDFVEIGTFLGGGAYKLSKFLERNHSDKKLFVLDVFDPTFDWTKTNDGKAMADVYKEYLCEHNGKSQWEVFSAVTRSCSNLEVIKKDSMSPDISMGPLSFGFIDGNHDPKYVENDFYLIWRRLSPGGVVAFHDYGWDLPQTTAKIDELTARHASEIASTDVD
jgi:hypothetical protein